MKPKILAVIPARFASRRFPGKALSIVAGKTMLEHIYREVSQAKLIDRVVVATDSKEIYSATEAFGGEAVITSKRHRTGSDRSAEVLQKLGGEILVSVTDNGEGIAPEHAREVLGSDEVAVMIDEQLVVVVFHEVVAEHAAVERRDHDREHRDCRGVSAQRGAHGGERLACSRAIAPSPSGSG